jgi:hypothetical protein
MNGKATLVLVLALPSGAYAQGFADNGMGTCYSWNGGNHSSGSFVKCNAELQPAKKAAVAPAPLAAAPSPMMMPMQSCPPVVVPQRKPKVMKKRPPPVKC